MSQNRTITIFEENVIVQNTLDSSGIEIIDDGANRVVEIITEGPRGPRGIQGPPGFSGAGEPFYVITSGSLYATTASLAILAHFSSSLLPWTGSFSQTAFDIGSLSHPWRSVYVSESIFIIKSGSVLVELKGSENTLEIGSSKISTSSFGFENNVINRLSTDQQTLLVQSASVSMSFNSKGVFIIPEFEFLPPVYLGGLIESGSQLFVGL